MQNIANSDNIYPLQVYARLRERFFGTVIASKGGTFNEKNSCQNSDDDISRCIGIKWV